MTGKNTRLWFVIILLVFTSSTITAQAQSPYEKALAKIEAAATAGATTLDLSSMGLTELPSEIGQLTNLEYLGLHGNFLQDPPLEVVEQGVKAILEYYRNLTPTPQPGD